MNKLPYDDLPFTSDREKQRFEHWLPRTPFNLEEDNALIRPEQIDWPVVLDLFREFRQRRREGWYCSFADCYDEALRDMTGKPLLFAGIPDEQLEEAKNYSCENMRICVSKILQLAKQGQPEAMFLAAEFHLHGLWVKKDERLTAEYTLKALDAGFEGAHGLLAILYFLGLGIEQNEGKALRQYDLAMMSHHAYCQKYLGIMYMEGMLCEKDTHKGREYLLKADAQGDMDATVILGYYNICDHVCEDTARDMRNVFAAALSHDLRAMYLMGSLLVHAGAAGDSLDTIRDGMKYIVEAANGEWPEAVSFLDDEYEFITLNDGRAVERGEFYDIVTPAGWDFFGKKYQMA